MDFGTPNIHCINLDRRPDRWANFQREAAKGRFAAQRWSAVDGSRLAEHELHALQARFAPQHGEMLRIWAGGHPKCVLACYLSHVQLLRHFVDQTDHERIVVFEDDALITGDMAVQRAWSDAFRTSRLAENTQWDLLALDIDGYGVPSPKDDSPHASQAHLRSFPRNVNFSRSHAYAATRAGAAKILATALHEPRAYDHHLWGDVAGGIPHNLIIVPVPVTCGYDDSDIRV